jgi:hypothetical protein
MLGSVAASGLFMTIYPSFLAALLAVEKPVRAPATPHEVAPAIRHQRFSQR